MRASSGVDGVICKSTSFDSLVVGCDADSTNDDRYPASGTLGGIGNGRALLLLLLRRRRYYSSLACIRDSGA